jgi:hypothetical protein
VLVASWSEQVSLLSLSQAWLGGCFVAAIWCGLRARGQGYSGTLFAGVGALLGLGAIPVTWLATREDLKGGGDGVGFTPQTVTARTDLAFLGWKRFYNCLRQLGFGLLFGVGGGLLTNVTQAITHLLPQIFAETAEEYAAAGHHSGDVFEMRIRLAWVLASLFAPTILYLLIVRLPRPRSLDRLWLYYATQSDSENWRQLISPRALSEAVPGVAEASCLRHTLNQRVIDWPTWLVPALLLAFYPTVGFLVALGFRAYLALMIH